MSVKKQAFLLLFGWDRVKTKPCSLGVCKDRKEAFKLICKAHNAVMQTVQKKLPFPSCPHAEDRVGVIEARIELFHLLSGFPSKRSVFSAPSFAALNKVSAKQKKSCSQNKMGCIDFFYLE